MRAIVYGTGAIGGTVGARLAMAGDPVILVARGAHGATIESDGLLFQWPDGEERLALPVVHSAGDITWTGEEVVLLAVKSQDTRAALADLLVAMPPDVPVVCLQNGVDNERQVLRVLPRVYGVCVMCPASHLEPGVVQAHSAPITGLLDIGRYPTGTDEIAEELAAALEAATFESRPLADVMRWKYRKLIMNLANAVDALLVPGDAADEVAARARSEGEACLQAAGIPVATIEEDRERRGQRLTYEPIAGQPRGGGSSWQSLARGTGSIEADFLNGEVVLLGRLHGIPTPVNALLQQLARQATSRGDQPGTLSGDMVLQATGAIPTDSRRSLET